MALPPKTIFKNGIHLNNIKFEKVDVSGDFALRIVISSKPEGELDYWLGKEQIKKLVKNLIKEFLTKGDKYELLDWLMKELGLREVSFRKL